MSAFSSIAATYVVVQLEGSGSVLGAIIGGTRQLL
jgi:hypothetical protein